MDCQEWCTFSQENKDEIYDNLRRKELLISALKSKTSQIDNRHTLISTMEHICEELELSKNVLHLSIFVLDHMMDEYNFDPKAFHVLLMCTIKISAKVSDAGDRVPLFSDLNELVGHQLATGQLFCMEQLILKHFNWKVSVPTVETFLRFFKRYIFLPQEVLANRKILLNFSDQTALERSLANEIENIALLAFEDLKVYRYPPSLLAAACIAVARLVFRITPIWSMQLHRITKYSFCDLRSVIRFLMRFYQIEDQPANFGSTTPEPITYTLPARLSICA